jgi:cell division protein FtsW (lipid II flippase)
MSRQQEGQISSGLNRYAIFCGATSVLYSVLACFSLLMMRYAFIENIERHGNSVFPNSFTIYILVIGILALSTIGLCLIVRYRRKRAHLHVIILSMTLVFLILYTIIALRLHFFWDQYM